MNKQNHSPYGSEEVDENGYVEMNLVLDSQLMGRGTNFCGKV